MVYTNTPEVAEDEPLVVEAFEDVAVKGAIEQRRNDCQQKLDSREASAIVSSPRGGCL